MNQRFKKGGVRITEGAVGTSIGEASRDQMRSGTEGHREDFKLYSKYGRKDWRVKRSDSSFVKITQTACVEGRL